MNNKEEQNQIEIETALKNIVKTNKETANLDTALEAADRISGKVQSSTDIVTTVAKTFTNLPSGSSASDLMLLNSSDLKSTVKVFAKDAANITTQYRGTGSYLSKYGIDSNSSFLDTTKAYYENSLQAVFDNTMFRLAATANLLNVGSGIYNRYRNRSKSAYQDINYYKSVASRKEEQRLKLSDRSHYRKLATEVTNGKNPIVGNFKEAIPFMTKKELTNISHLGLFYDLDINSKSEVYSKTGNPHVEKEIKVIEENFTQNEINTLGRKIRDSRKSHEKLLKEIYGKNYKVVEELALEVSPMTMEYLLENDTSYDNIIKLVHDNILNRYDRTMALANESDEERKKLLESDPDLFDTLRSKFSDPEETDRVIKEKITNGFKIHEIATELTNVTTSLYKLRNKVLLGKDVEENQEKMNALLDKLSEYKNLDSIYLNMPVMAELALYSQVIKQDCIHVAMGKTEEERNIETGKNEGLLRYTGRDDPEKARMILSNRDSLIKLVIDPTLKNYNHRISVNDKKQHILSTSIHEVFAEATEEEMRYRDSNVKKILNASMVYESVEESLEKTRLNAEKDKSFMKAATVATASQIAISALSLHPGVHKDLGGLKIIGDGFTTGTIYSFISDMVKDPTKLFTDTIDRASNVIVHSPNEMLGSSIVYGGIGVLLYSVGAFYKGIRNNFKVTAIERGDIYNGKHAKLIENIVSEGTKLKNAQFNFGGKGNTNRVDLKESGTFLRKLSLSATNATLNPVRQSIGLLKASGNFLKTIFTDPKQALGNLFYLTKPENEKYYKKGIEELPKGYVSHMQLVSAALELDNQESQNAKAILNRINPDIQRVFKVALPSPDLETASAIEKMHRSGYASKDIIAPAVNELNKVFRATGKPENCIDLNQIEKDITRKTNLAGEVTVKCEALYKSMINCIELNEKIRSNASAISKIDKMMYGNQSNQYKDLKAQIAVDSQLLQQSINVVVEYARTESRYHSKEIQKIADSFIPFTIGKYEDTDKLLSEFAEKLGVEATPEQLKDHEYLLNEVVVNRVKQEYPDIDLDKNKFDYMEDYMKKALASHAEDAISTLESIKVNEAKSIDNENNDIDYEEPALRPSYARKNTNELAFNM